MTKPLAHGDVQGAQVLKALAHPLRQQILSHLEETGSATSSTLARDLGKNSGITSYHLRLLAKRGLIQEITERSHGKERWWQLAPETHWVSRDKFSPAGRASMAEAHRRSIADDVDLFEQFRAERASAGEWGTGTWASMRSALTLTREEAGEFIAEQKRLIGRYLREPADVPAGTRTVIVRFLAYPEPASHRGGEGTGEPGGPED